VHSSDVGAHAGLTSKGHQSGEIDYDGGICKSGDVMLHTMLYEAAQSMLTHSRNPERRIATKSQKIGLPGSRSG
tara:strand:- start:54 stop:275 length:222 start_codon:yes stop_codon:yes gene_type:complete